MINSCQWFERSEILIYENDCNVSLFVHHFASDRRYLHHKRRNDIFIIPQKASNIYDMILEVLFSWNEGKSHKSTDVFNNGFEKKIHCVKHT